MKILTTKIAVGDLLTQLEGMSPNEEVTLELCCYPEKRQKVEKVEVVAEHETFYWGNGRVDFQ